MEKDKKHQGFRKGYLPWNKGKKLSKTHKDKIGRANLGKKRTVETRKKLSKVKKGTTHSKAVRKKIGEAQKGEKSHLWKGGISTYKRRLWQNSRYRAKRKGAEGNYTQGEWELLKRQYGHVCPACERKEPKILLTQDHIIPLSKGGSDYIENIQPLCKSCNSRKRTKTTKYGK